MGYLKIGLYFTSRSYFDNCDAFHTQVIGMAAEQWNDTERYLAWLASLLYNFRTVFAVGDGTDSNMRSISAEFESYLRNVRLGLVSA